MTAAAKWPQWSRAILLTPSLSDGCYDANGMACDHLGHRIAAVVTCCLRWISSGFKRGVQVILLLAAFFFFFFCVILCVR